MVTCFLFECKVTYSAFRLRNVSSVCIPWNQICDLELLVKATFCYWHCTLASSAAHSFRFVMLSLETVLALCACETFILGPRLSSEVMSSPSLQACRQEMIVWLSVFPGRIVSPDKLPRKYCVNFALETSPPANMNIDMLTDNKNLLNL